MIGLIQKNEKGNEVFC